MPLAVRPARPYAVPVSEPMTSSDRWRKLFGRLGLGCGVLAVLGALGLVGGIWAYVRWAEAQRLQAEAAQEAAAKETFGPALTGLDAPPARPYDIDETIRVVHEIDAALQQKMAPEDYLRLMARQDYRDVAPEILKARKEMLDLSFQLYAKQTEKEERDATWAMSSELLLTALSVVSVQGDVGATGINGGFHVDREQARKALADLQEQRRAREDLGDEIRAIEDQLFERTLDYSLVYYKYVDEWDRLCNLRDRAYLAVNNRDWTAAAAASREAIAMAPDEKEAHLLLALALIEGGNADDLPEAKATLQDYTQRHPDATAPALLLQGVIARRSGDTAAATLAFQQSAAYYPKQAESLTSMLDPYKQRSFLRKSREGNWIVELYQSTMIGAGYFSPDLQLAAQSFDAGDFYGGKKKVLDHFARRRAQGQWDAILSDVQFSQGLLGEQFRQIFPQDAWVDLETSRSMLSSGLQVAVNNRSDRELKNASLVLCVHFTDMHPDDYETFSPTRTIPSVPPRTKTDFGEVDLHREVGGRDKTLDDVVTLRAILVTDDAVLWVDTEDFKKLEAKTYAEAEKAKRPLPDQKTDWHQKLAHTMDDTARTLRDDQATLTAKPSYGFKDALQIELPAQLAILKPVFTLEYGGQQFKATSNVIDDDHIVLTFDGVGNFDGGETGDVKLDVDSVFGSVQLTWAPGGAMAWSYAGSAPK